MIQVEPSEGEMQLRRISKVESLIKKFEEEPDSASVNIDGELHVGLLFADGTLYTIDDFKKYILPGVVELLKTKLDEMNNEKLNYAKSGMSPREGIAYSA